MSFRYAVNTVLEAIISRMGELHLEIYVERMKREYNVACTTGKAPTAGQSLNGRTSISRTRSARNWLCRADGVGCRTGTRVIGSLNQRRGTILDSEVRDEEFVCTAEVPLSDMFGYSSQLRGVTQSKGEFSMVQGAYSCVLSADLELILFPARRTCLSPRMFRKICQRLTGRRCLR